METTINGEAILKSLNVKIAFIQGGSAGAHTLTGITTDDALLSVMHVTTAVEGTYGFTISSCADLLSEFSITDDDEITNTTTDTSNDFLLILWEDVA